MGLDDPEATYFSDVVLELANREGGAHVDPTLAPEFQRLSQDGSLGGAFFNKDGEQPWSNSPAEPSMRQIVHEMLRTLDESVNQLLDP